MRNERTPHPSHRSPPSGPCLWVKVADTGIGIAESELARIFEPFEQTAGVPGGPRPPRAGGTGLGLAISVELVRLLGGDLVVASREGVGSVFLVVVPCTPSNNCSTVNDTAAADDNAAADAPPMARPARPSAAAGRRKSAGGEEEPATTPFTHPPLRRRSTTGAATTVTVLVADDNPTVRDVLARQLRSMHCDVVLTADGRDCVDHVRSSFVPASDGGLSAPAADVVLMDLHMPGLDGLQAAAAIRALEGHTGRRVPIIALTGDDPNDVRVLCRDAGMDDCVQKPATAVTLRALLHRYAPNM